MKLNCSEPESLIAEAKKDSLVREKFIMQNEQTILKIASKTCMKFVSKSDDEWSVALCAFSKAIDNYDSSRGNFMVFASTLIQHDLIDYNRRENQYSSELFVSPEAFDGNSEEEGLEVSHVVAERSIVASNCEIQEEITDLSAALASFGIHFMDLTNTCPKQSKTRMQCLHAATSLSRNATLYKKMRKTYRLPSSEIALDTGLSIKLLDKYRKYIITSAIILSEDYPHLADYLKP